MKFEEQRLPWPSAVMAMPALVLVAPGVAFGLLWLAWVADPSWVEIHGSSCRCIHDERLLVAWKSVRVATFLTAVALFVLAGWSWRRRRAAGTSWSAIGRYGLAVALALLCSEAYLRRPKPVNPPPNGYSPAHIPDPVFAWRLTPASEHAWRQGGRAFEYAVNDEGNRARSIHDDSVHDRPTILVGGESIAMGMGIPYEDSFAALLEARAHVQVVDLGVDAYGLDQAYLRDREVIGSYSRALAVVTIFHQEVASRAEVEDRPRLRVDGQANLVLVPPTAPWIRDLQLRALFRGIYHSSAELDDLRAITRAVAILARSHGAYPLFVTVTFDGPCFDVEGKPPFLFRTLFDDQDVPRIDVPLPASERLSDDPHPGSQAHVRIANAVEKALREAKVLGPS